MRNRHHYGAIAGAILLIVAAFAVTGGSFYLAHSSYQHHNPEHSFADFLYGVAR